MMVDNSLAEPQTEHADAGEAASSPKETSALFSRLLYSAALLASLSIWLLALRAPLWLDETLAYWQVSGGFAKIWSRSALMPSSIGYLYTLWAAKSILGSHEIALKIPSTLAMLGAVYFLFRAAREFFDQDIAFLVCIFFALEPNVVFAATDARPYAFALLATNLAIFAFLRWIKQHKMRQAIAFGAAAAAILYFHYLFGAILPAFAIYYLTVRRRSIKADARQLAAVLATFTLISLPLLYRVISLYHTRDTHVVQELPVKWIALNTLVPIQTLIGFLAAVFLAALARKVKLTVADYIPAALLCLLLALVPAGILIGVSTTTSLHLVIPRYFLVVAPGSALTWGLLTSRIDSRWLRQIFCVGLVGVTVFECYSSPYSRKHELSFKKAHELVNASVAQDHAPVLTCSAFIEADYEPLPTDRTSENALNSQFIYYPIDAPVVLLPMSFNDEARRIAGRAAPAATQLHQRFLVVGSPNCYPTIDWLASSSRGEFTVRSLGDFDEIAVVEFQPVAQGN